MKHARPALAAAALLAGLSLEARVVSYAPITSRQAVPAVQKRTNRHALLREQVSVVFPGAGPACICFQTQSRLVVYDTQGLEEPRDVTPGGAPGIFNSAAAFESPDGTLFLYANGYPAADLPVGVLNYFSRDGGRTWTGVAGMPANGFGTGYGFMTDVGGPISGNRGSSILPGSPEAPFFAVMYASTGRELWTIASDGSARRLAAAPTQLALLGTDREGRRVLFSGKPAAPGPGTGTLASGVWSVDLDGALSLLAPLPEFAYTGPTDGWLTPGGEAYLNSIWQGSTIPPGFTAHRSVLLAAGGSLHEIVTSSSLNPSASELFAVPTAEFSGAWVLRRGDGPTILSSHSPAGGLVEAWRDETRPEVEALHVAISGNRLLVQVHRPRPTSDRRSSRPRARGLGGRQAGARGYDELFLTRA